MTKIQVLWDVQHCRLLNSYLSCLKILLFFSLYLDHCQYSVLKLATAITFHIFCSWFYHAMLFSFRINSVSLNKI
jgi:hypothetical protein